MKEYHCHLEGEVRVASRQVKQEKDFNYYPTLPVLITLFIWRTEVTFIHSLFHVEHSISKLNLHFKLNNSMSKAVAYHNNSCLLIVSGLNINGNTNNFIFLASHPHKRYVSLIMFPNLASFYSCSYPCFHNFLGHLNLIYIKYIHHFI